jgi:broad specificity phosphatase PhoE
MRVDFADPDWVTTAENRYNPPLHHIGLRQAEETGQRLAVEVINHIVASPFQRTLQTASIIADTLGGSVKVETGFSEWLSPKHFDYQPVVGDPATLLREYPLLDPEYRSYREAKYPESRPDLDQRTSGALSQILDDLSGNVLIVSHGSPIEAIHKALTGAHPESMATMASVSRYEFDGGSWRATAIGDSSHLSTPDETHRVF